MSRANIRFGIELTAYIAKALASVQGALALGAQVRSAGPLSASNCTRLLRLRTFISAFTLFAFAATAIADVDVFFLRVSQKTDSARPVSLAL